ncbi:MAG: hypothetical protein J6T92_02400, partial [Ottowia sp.]|nr:hypothetical protein [Ottowia sp.]
RAVRRRAAPVRREAAEVPNAETRAAMEEALSGNTMKHASLDAMFEDCGIDIKKIRAAKKS